MRRSRRRCPKEAEGIIRANPLNETHAETDDSIMACNLGWLPCFQFFFFGAKFKKSSRKRKKHKLDKTQVRCNRQQALALVMSIEHTSGAWSTCSGPVASNRHACLTLDVTRPLRVTQDSCATPRRAETPPTALVFRRHVGKDCDVWRVLEWYENEREKPINGGIGLGWDARRSTQVKI